MGFIRLGNPKKHALHHQKMRVPMECTKSQINELGTASHEVALSQIPLKESDKPINMLGLWCEVMHSPYDPSQIPA